MGSRANTVIMRNGRRHVYYSRHAGQYMDALVFWGPEHIVAEVTSEWDEEGWSNDLSAEGGCCIDLDRHHLIFYGGEVVDSDMLTLETYLSLLPYTWPGWTAYTWPGWTVEWSWGALTQIALYSGVGPDVLRKIDCGKGLGLPPRRDSYIDRLLDDARPRPLNHSTISATRDGVTRSALIPEEWPERLIYLEGDIERVIGRLPADDLVCGDDEFPLGGLHLDYDRHEIQTWRTWDTHVAVDIPAYWSGWRFVDHRHHYRKFYSSVPRLIEFTPRSEDMYLRRIGDWVCTDGLSLSPDGLGARRRSDIFEEVLGRYRADNPVPRMLPEL